MGKRQYLTDSELIDEFEKKRKAMEKEIGVRISQPRFTKYLKPTLTPVIRGFNLNLRRKKNAKKK